MMLRVNQHCTWKEKQLLPMPELWPGAMLGRVCSQSHCQGRWKRGNHPILHSCPSLMIYLSTTSLIPSPVSTNCFFLYIRKKKISFSSIFLSSSGLQSSPRRKLQDSTSDQCYHIWSLSLLPPMGPTAIAAFSWKRLCSISENKITNFIPKISQHLQSQFLIYSWMNPKEKSHFCKIQECDWEDNSKASSSVPFLSLLHNPLLPLWAQWRWVTTFCIRLINVYKWFLSHALMHAN